MFIRPMIYKLLDIRANVEIPHSPKFRYYFSWVGVRSLQQYAEMVHGYILPDNDLEHLVF